MEQNETVLSHLEMLRGIKVSVYEFNDFTISLSGDLTVIWSSPPPFSVCLNTFIFTNSAYFQAILQISSRICDLNVLPSPKRNELTFTPLLLLLVGDGFFILSIKFAHDTKTDLEGGSDFPSPRQTWFLLMLSNWVAMQSRCPSPIRSKSTIIESESS